MSKIISPSIIYNEHEVASFDCGVDVLNTFLKKYALVNVYNNSSRTYVACRGDKVIGYYTLSYGSILHGFATKRVTKGILEHPIPVMVLARLAVDLSEQKGGIGKGLLKDAILRTMQASEIAGLRAIIVHAKDTVAQKFYIKYGFESSPIDELHLMLLMKDAIKSI